MLHWQGNLLVELVLKLGGGGGEQHMKQNYLKSLLYCVTVDQTAYIAKCGSPAELTEWI